MHAFGKEIANREQYTRNTVRKMYQTGNLTKTENVIETVCPPMKEYEKYVLLTLFCKMTNQERTDACLKMIFNGILYVLISLLL